MDLGTVKKKLIMNTNEKPEEFKEDVSQIFINCKLFNVANNV